MPEVKKTTARKPGPSSIWQNGEIVGWFGSFPKRVEGGARFPQLMMSKAFREDIPFSIASTHFLLRRFDSSVENALGYPADKIYLDVLCDVLALESDGIGGGQLPAPR